MDLFFFFFFFTVQKGGGANMLEAWETLILAAVTFIHLDLDRVPTTLINQHTQSKKVV